MHPARVDDQPDLCSTHSASVMPTPAAQCFAQLCCARVASGTHVQFAQLSSAEGVLALKIVGIKEWWPHGVFALMVCGH